MRRGNDMQIRSSGQTRTMTLQLMNEPSATSVSQSVIILHFVLVLPELFTCLRLWRTRAGDEEQDDFGSTVVITALSELTDKPIS